MKLTLNVFQQQVFGLFGVASADNCLTLVQICLPLGTQASKLAQITELSRIEP